MFSKNLTNEFIESEIKAKPDEDDSVRDYKQNMLKLVINASSQQSGSKNNSDKRLATSVSPKEVKAPLPRVSKSVEHTAKIEQVLQKPVASKFGISYL